MVLLLSQLNKGTEEKKLLLGPYDNYDVDLQRGVKRGMLPSRKKFNHTVELELCLVRKYS